MNPGIFSDKSIHNLFKHNVCTFSVAEKELVRHQGWYFWLIMLGGDSERKQNDMLSNYDTLSLSSYCVACLYMYLYWRKISAVDINWGHIQEIVSNNIIAF